MQPLEANRNSVTWHSACLCPLCQQTCLLFCISAFLLRHNAMRLTCTTVLAALLLAAGAATAVQGVVPAGLHVCTRPQCRALNSSKECCTSPCQC